jgi:multiple sugar transport system substrate-binding protein
MIRKGLKLSFLFIAALVLTVFAVGPLAGQAKVVNVWTHYAASTDLQYWQALEKDFFAKTGIKMNTTVAPQRGNVYMEKLATMLASKDDSFDATEFPSGTTSSYVAAGYIASIDDIVTPAMRKDFTILDGVNIIDGKLYSLPCTSESVFLFVNKDLFRKAGLKYPRTQKEFIDTGKALTKGGVYATGAYWSKDFLNVELPRYILQFNADIYNWNNPNNREMLQYMYDLIYTYKIMPESVLADNMDVLNQKFIDGKYAMVYQYPYLADGLGKKFLTMAEIAPVPTYKSNKTIFGGWSFGLNAQAVNKSTAAEFIKYLTTKDAQTFFCSFSTAMSAGSNSVMSDPKIVAKLPVLKYVAQYSAAGSNASVITDPRDGIAAQARADAIHRFLTKQIKIDEAIALCQKGVEEMKNQ